MEATAVHDTHAISQRSESVPEWNGKQPNPDGGQSDPKTNLDGNVVLGNGNDFSPKTINVCVNVSDAAADKDTIASAVAEVTGEVFKAVKLRGKGTESE